ncbi:MAG: GntR family transcriptional regulator, partial [Burkholderiaceae bacterium]
MGGQLDFGRGLPAYRVVKDRLIQALASGHYPAGSSLPAEKQLAEEHGVSIGTLRKAVDSLVSEGILIRQQGKGTFVSQHDNQRLLYYYFHIVPQGQQKVRPTTKLLRFQRARAGEEAAERLRIGVSSWVFKIRNLLLIQTKPVIV